MLKDKMTMLILSCDKFSDLWEGHVQLLKKNWPDNGMRVFIITDEPTNKEYDDIKIVAAGSDVEWSYRLSHALSLVETPYVFITLDDYFLVKPVITNRINDLISAMDDLNLDYIRLYPRPKAATRKKIPGYANLRWIDTSVKYSVNLYSCIWRKNFAVSTITSPLNAWRFEVSLPKKALEYKAKCAVSSGREFEILDVVRKGKLLHKSARYFEKHPGIYNGDREVNTWQYEANLWIKTMVSRHTPKPVRDWIRSVMHKMGYTFFSDESGL